MFVVAGPSAHIRAGLPPPPFALRWGVSGSTRDPLGLVGSSFALVTPKGKRENSERRREVTQLQVWDSVGMPRELLLRCTQI